MKLYSYITALREQLINIKSREDRLDREDSHSLLFSYAACVNLVSDLL